LSRSLSKNSVSSRPDHETLQFCILRGTDVIEEHEKALVEVITNPDYDTDEKTEEGIVNFIAGGYDVTAFSPTSNKQHRAIANGKTHKVINYEENNVDEACDPDDDADCLVDDMYNLWASMEDYSVVSKTENSSTGTDTSTSQTATTTNRPWSVRSSPSGTFVRDPSTGKMRNIG
jgi:hypothetical protein